MRRVAVIILALAEARCSIFLAADTGYSHAFAQAPERSALPINAYAGVGAGGNHGGIGGGMGLRSKWSDNVQQFSLAPFMYAFVGPEMVDGSPPAAFFFLCGYDLFTIESVAGNGEGSIGSPFAEVGGFFHLHKALGITAGVSIEDDIRFDGTPSTGYVSFLIGLAAIGSREGNFLWH